MCVCNNCNGIITYDESDIDSRVDYVQANPVQKGNLLTWEFNVFKKVKKYYISCLQCKKNTVCGIEVLENRAYI